jgi:hypothetical protein
LKRGGVQEKPTLDVERVLVYTPSAGERQESELRNFTYMNDLQTFMTSLKTLLAECTSEEKRCLISVEEHLPLDYRVSQAQSGHTIWTTNSVRKVVSELTNPNSAVFKTASVRNIRRLLQKDIDSETIAEWHEVWETAFPENEKDKGVYKYLNLRCLHRKCYNVFRTFATLYPEMDTVLNNNNNGPIYFRRIASHPISDLVDAAAVAFWLSELDKYLVYPR